MILAALLLALAGCGEVPPEEPSRPSGDGLREVHYDLNDGRTVTCIVATRMISCDWEHAE